jgi:hypothetical protein
MARPAVIDPPTAAPAAPADDRLSIEIHDEGFHVDMEGSRVALAHRLTQLAHRVLHDVPGPSASA